MPLASLGDSFSSFFDAVGDFASNLAAVNWLSLLIALALFIGYLSLRALASFRILRAAYPDERFPFRHIWGAYLAGYGFNAVVPARGGDIVRLFLTKTSVPHSSYPAVASSFTVELVFDLTMAIPILIFAFSQGAFPKPPDFSKLPAFDLAFFASNPQFTLFLLTASAIAALAAFALLSARVRAFWQRVRQGLTILFDRRRYFREVWLVQLAGLGAALRRLLVPARGVQRRRLGAQRAARAGRERRRRARAVHAGRGGRAAGAAGQGLRRERRGRHRGGLFGRAADRDRRGDVRLRLRRARVHLPLPLVQGGDRGRPGG